jgi:hypothetical protein
VAVPGVGFVADQEPEAARIFRRIVHGNPPTVDDFKTQRERNVPRPDTNSLEELFSWAYGVTVTNTKQQALKKARGLRGRLGRYVVGVHIEPDGPVRYHKTLGSGHFDLLGESQDILARVVLPVEDALEETPSPADH